MGKGRSMVVRIGIVAAALTLLLAAHASAATRTWDGGCGGNTNWSCAANWSENTAPGSADVAVFNGTSTNNAVADEGFGGAVASIQINSGYTGTISLGRSLQVLGLFKQVTGTFSAAGQSLDIKTFTLTGGSFTASSGITSIKAAMTIAGASTFNANGGTVDFYGTGGALACGGATFSHVVFTHTSGTKTVGASCSMPLGEDPSAGSGGALSLNGTLSGTGTITTFKKLTLGKTGKLSGFSGLKANAVVIAGGSYDFGKYAPFTVSGDFTVNPGATFVAPTGVASFGKGFTIGSGASFKANEGTVRFTSKTAFALACNNQEFTFVVFESIARKTIGSDCTLPMGGNPELGKGGMVLNGTLSGSGTLSETGLIEVGSSDPGFDSFTNVVDNGSLALTPKTVFTAPKGTLTLDGNLTVSEGATFNANEGTVDFNATYRTVRTLSCGEVAFFHVVVTNVGGQVIGSDCKLPLGANPTIGKGGQIELNGVLTGTGSLTAHSELLTLGEAGSLSGFSGFSSGALAVAGAYDFGAYAPFSVAGDFTIVPGGKVKAPSGTAEFSGDFTNGGAFEANGGTVKLTGSGQALGGSTTFNDLTKVATAADTLTFAAGATQTVAGMLTLRGVSATELLGLVSSAPGTKWLLAGSGSRSAKWLSVKDSENTGAEIAAVESTDGGGNTGWSF
jgi:fibronectin-binding autotransporter adhesin